MHPAMKARFRASLKKVMALFNVRVMRLRKHDISGLSGDLPRDLALVVRREHPILFDVGANEGQTIEMFRQCFKRPVIYAFEPSGTMCEVLRSRIYPDVHLIAAAVGSASTSAVFNNYTDSRLSSLRSMSGDTVNPFATQRLASREVVPVVTVDGTVKDRGIHRIDLLKSDTQGYDLQVLMGAQETFSRGLVDSVLVEINFIRMYEEQDSAADIMAFLAEYRFQPVGFYEVARKARCMDWCTGLFSRRT